MPHYTEDLSRNWLLIPLLLLYLPYLGGVGFIGPDEPRYASIGRAMAVSGDWVTPRLDGQPWFEKPPLLYWTIAVGHELRLPDEWAARLPIALASIAFLIFFYGVIEREFSARAALAATTILATSAGWLTYSFAALTDLLMSATLGAAMLLALFDTAFDARRKLSGYRGALGSPAGYVVGALLGASMLAKGFVPLVLFAPVFLVARGKRLTSIAGCIVVAAPWYVLCSIRNGSAFWMDFFWKHHVERFLSSSLQHVQPFWYYIPVLLAGLFPWTPLAGLLLLRKTYDDVRVRFLTLWLLYALVFFSAAQNKLPGYILPLMPALAILLAVSIDRCPESPFGVQWVLGASGLMLMIFPAISAALPDALLSGLSKAHLVFAHALPFVVIAAAAWVLAWRNYRTAALVTVAMSVAVGIAYLKIAIFPVLDQRVSVRAFVTAHTAEVSSSCLERVPRSWEYGLAYYAGHALPPCSGTATEARPRVTVRDSQLVVVDQ